jgi:hypothetical protein
MFLRIFGDGYSQRKAVAFLAIKCGEMCACRHFLTNIHKLSVAGIALELDINSAWQACQIF